jgi:hypothetical protein
MKKQKQLQARAAAKPAIVQAQPPKQQQELIK